MNEDLHAPSPSKARKGCEVIVRAPDYVVIAVHLLRELWSEGQLLTFAEKLLDIEMVGWFGVTLFHLGSGSC